MAYVTIPPTVAKAYDVNIYQRERLRQWQHELDKYPKLCPQLQGPIAELQNLLKILQHHTNSQESLIQQRIQLQTALVYPDLLNRSHTIAANAPATHSFPQEILIPDIEYKTPPPKTRLLIKSQARAFEDTKIVPSPIRPPLKVNIVNNAIQVSPNNSFSQDTGTRLHAHRNRKRPRTLLPKPQEWASIPPNLKCFPSVIEQLIKIQEPKLTPKEWRNRFAPLFIDYSDVHLTMASGTMQPDTAEAPDVSPHSEAEMTDEPTNPPLPPMMGPPEAASKLTLDMLRDLVPVPTLDPAMITESPTTYATAVRVAPQGFEKVRLEVNIGRFPKDTDRTERILSLFNVAKLYDKHVCLCPSGSEPNPVLYTPYDIKRSRVYRYFQDKPGAQKGKYTNSLYGYIVFGVTGDVDDFVMAMKEWATSNRHELARHGVPSSSVVAGFIVHSSLTLNRDDMVAAIRNTSEWHNAGNPDFSLKISPLWSSGGADAKVPAICCECERSKVAEFEKMCEALFFGENLSLPSAIRAAYFFPSRKFAANDPSRLAYIGGQRDFLTTERTITCGGLENVYQEVRLRRDPRYSSSVEDILLLLQGTKGPLFRSMDRTTDNKVFLKLDDNNIGAWMLQKNQIGDHLRALVHPEDYSKVFTMESQELVFSEPWMKFKDGQLTKNVMQLPCKASLEYVNRYKAKFTPKEPTLPPLAKKRIHSNVSNASTTSTASATTVSSHTTSPSASAPVLPGNLTNPGTIVDLTTTGSDSVASPSHKVHVVEQRAFHGTTSPMSSMDGSLASDPRNLSPKTARMHQLESKVAAHDQKLTAIQTSVSSLDAKIVSQGEQSSFQFNRFEEMLSHIHGTIVQGMQRISDPNGAQPSEMMDEIQAHEDYDDAYDPIRKSREWNEEWRRYQLSKSRVDSQRAECAAQLCKEAESKGECYDYYAVASERFPSPPPVNFPDDITYTDDL